MFTKRFLALLNTLILVSTLPGTLKPEKYTEKKEFITAGKFYGNKTKNLAILDALGKEKNIQKLCEENNVSLAVPEFQGISHEEILGILKTLNINLQERWENVISLIKEKKDIILNKKEALPKEFLDALETLANDIEKATNNAKLPKEIKQFIKKAKENQWHLMVRSTGKEDSEEVANAGGNESVANVNPDQDFALI